MRNVPNLLSASRIIMLAPLVALILIDQPWSYIIATPLFALVALTDTLDGRLARRYKLVSNLGIFLDLTADKMLVSGVFIAMVEVHLVPSWIVIVIVAREFIVMGMRSLAAAQGKVIPAGRSGKQKTLITLIAIGGIMLARALGAHLLTLFPPHLTLAPGQLNLGEILLLVSDILVLLALVWTIYSAIEYIRGAWFLFRPQAPVARPEVVSEKVDESSPA